MMKWRTCACFCFILKAMQAGFSAKTGLGQYTVGENTQDYEEKEKCFEYFQVSKRISTIIDIFNMRETFFNFNFRLYLKLSM